MALFYEFDNNKDFITTSNQLFNKAKAEIQTAIPEDIIIILFVTIEHLRKPAFFETLANFRIIKSEFKPVITIGAEDIMLSDPEKSLTEDGIKRKKDWRSILNPDHRYKFLDSSIWNYYLPYDESFEGKLAEICLPIRKNYENGLYSTNVSREFIEFQSRLLANSYLNNFGAGHASSVIPFPFHSESQMKNRYNEDVKNYISFQGSNFAKGLQWRFLLIDDKSTIPLSIVNKTAIKENLKHTKAFIIGNVLELIGVDVILKEPTRDNENNLFKSIENLFEKPNDRLGITVELNCVSTIVDAMKAIESPRGCYDLILLDFLLDETEKKFGSDFFDPLLNSNQPDNKKLFKRHWIFSISSYHLAFLDAIHSTGRTLIGHSWYFSRGADPVNTPQLFLQQLIQFIGVQLREIGIEEEKGELKFKNITELWKESLKELSEKSPFTRGWANRTLAKILGYWEKIESLKISRDGGSLFALSFLNSEEMESFYNKKVMEEYKNGLYGYITHLLFMLAYSDGYEWEEMKTNLEMVKAITKTSEAQNFKDEQIKDKNENPTVQKSLSILNKRIDELKQKYDQ